MASKSIFNFKFIIFIFWVSVFSLVKASAPDSLTYTVGVVEFTPTFDGTPEEALEKNMKGYQDMLNHYVAVNDDVDIIIFPDSSLNIEDNSVFVPDPRNPILLCNERIPNSDMLSQLSCWAAHYKKYMVFNIKEKENCTVESQKHNNDKRPCSTDELSHYNTNIVFDRNGTLISRYRNWNLYDGNIMNTTSTSEYIRFKTDFGVEFVSIISFDVLWWTPTMEFVKKGYTNFVHPIWWFSELPFMTANQVHQGWAYAANVNLLTSAGNNAHDGATGSAIFNGRAGPLVAEMSSQPTSKILIAKVPKSNSQNIDYDQIPPSYDAVPDRLLGLSVDRDKTVDSYANILLNSTDLNVTAKVCHDDKFCCDFKIIRKPFINTENKNHYSYRLIAFSGPRNFTNSKQQKWMKACAVIACTDDKSIDSCAKIFSDDTIYWNTHYFESIEIKANFKKIDKMLIMPNSVDAMFKPIPVNAFDLSSVDVGKTTTAVMTLTKPVSDLITFGIFTDYYRTFNSATLINSSLIIIFMVALSNLIFVN